MTAHWATSYSAGVTVVDVWRCLPIRCVLILERAWCQLLVLAGASHSSFGMSELRTRRLLLTIAMVKMVIRVAVNALHDQCDPSRLALCRQGEWEADGCSAK